jgi:PAS domain S-box-containing protein
MRCDTSAYGLFLDRSSDAILRIDLDRCYRYANSAAHLLTGIPAQELIGKPVSETRLSEDINPAWEHAIESALATGEAQTIEFRSSVGQRTSLLRASVLPEHDSHGKTISALAVIHDMSKRERMEKEHEDLLMRERSARVQAETAARARDEFLAIVSHELRAPLHGIQTWAHVLENQLKDVGSPGIAQRAIAGIKTGVSQQVRLIDDLLDVTRMMSGKLRLIKHPFSLLPVVQAAVQSVAELAATKGIKIDCDFHLGAEKIDGDADRIQQALWNLLTNAIKFTPQAGHIKVEAHCSDSHAVVAVSDNGAGISREFLPHLFDRFSQEDTSSTRRHNGLGLGLFLVRHLIEMHGGVIKADSPGERQGARFSIELPLRLRRHPTISALQSELGEHTGSLPSLQGLNILLIDDQEEARESLSMVLSVAGASVFAAASSREIFASLNATSAEYLPDVVILDIAMPIEDGYAVLRKLRTWQCPKGVLPLQRVPALALTAFAQREDRIRALTAGFQMHVAKPVAPEELIVVIAMMASTR